MAATGRTKRSFPLWTALGVVVIVALVVGSGALSGAPPTAQQRAAAIESDLRCPSCEDLSVAQSSAPTAVTVRAAVAQMIAGGKTDRQIESFLVARYGGAIVLDPPGDGVTLLVWLLPLLGGLAALCGVIVVLVRRRSIRWDPEPEAPLDEVVVAERRRFLEGSLADADAEYLAGDLSDGDYLALRRRDMAALAALPAAAETATLDRPASERSSVAVADPPAGSGGIEEGQGGGARPPAPPLGDRGERRSRLPRPRRSGWYLIGAAAAFGAAVVLAATLFATSRLPGQTETGSVGLNQTQQIEETLAQAAVYENQGQLAKAAGLYEGVLGAHPDNEVALGQLGWLEYESGQQGTSSALMREGQAKLDRAVQLDPGDPAARLYLGTVLLEHGDATGAVVEYQDFLADNPSATTVRQAAPEISQAYRDVGQPVPADVSG